MARDLDPSVRPQVMLLAAQGLDNREIAARLRCPREVIMAWRERFYEQCLVGLDQPRARVEAAARGAR